MYDRFTQIQQERERITEKMEDPELSDKEVDELADHLILLLSEELDLPNYKYELGEQF